MAVGIYKDRPPASREMVNDWNSFDELITYPVSGPFVSYLAENYDGIEKYKGLLVEGKKTNFGRVFLNIYQKKIKYRVRRIEELCA